MGDIWKISIITLVYKIKLFVNTWYNFFLIDIDNLLNVTKIIFFGVDCELTILYFRAKNENLYNLKRTKLLTSNFNSTRFKFYSFFIATFFIINPSMTRSEVVEEVVLGPKGLIL